MTTPLQAARHKRGWSQGRLVWELTKLAQNKGASVATSASLKTLISRWENGHATPDASYQPLLCKLYGSSPAELGFGCQSLPEHNGTIINTPTPLLTKEEWTRDDLHVLSATFDDALTRSSVRS